MLNFGETVIEGEEISVTDDQRSRHMFIVGKSGGGKSKLLEHMLRYDIVDNPKQPGLLLIDPHGKLYDDVVRFCADIGVKRNIRLFNPSDTSKVYGYNPLRPGVCAPEVIARSMAEGTAHVWGEDSGSTPMIRETLIAVYYALVHNNLTLGEAHHLLSLKQNNKIREYLTSDFGDNYVIQEKWDNWEQLQDNARTMPDFSAQMRPADRRLFEFNLSAICRNIFGQREHTLDIPEAIENGDIVLVNLSTKKQRIDKGDASLIGTLMLRDLYISALARDGDEEYMEENPFYVYVDECYRFLTKDVEDMLDETRKFGVHLVLACQRLEQLHKMDMYSPILGGTEIKAVFGGMRYDDCIDMAKELYTGDLDLHRGVESSKRSVVVGEIEDVVVDHSYGGAVAHGSVSGDGTGVSTSIDADGNEMITESDSGSSSTTETHTKTHSRTERNVTRNVYETHYSDRWSLDELWHEKARILKTLPKQYSVVHIHNHNARTIRVCNVWDPDVAIGNALTKLYIDRYNENAPHVLSLEEGEKIISDRRVRLHEAAGVNPKEYDDSDPWSGG